MSIKEAILKVNTVWLSYDQIAERVNALRYKQASSGSVDRRVRELINLERLEVRRKPKKHYNEYRRIR